MVINQQFKKLLDPALYFLDPIAQKRLSAIQHFPCDVVLSLDMGLDELQVRVESSAIHLPEGGSVPLPGREFIKADDTRTILICRAGQWQKWQRYDEATGKFYKMVFVKAGKPPTVEISGIKMHVTRNGDPVMDTSRKMDALGRVSRRVLDTCCGLGYTAIALAGNNTVREVVTIERDNNIIQLCRENPWSRELFASEKISLLHGNTATLIERFDDRSFAAVLHDPPRFALAPELYEVSFYRDCCRVLENKGRLYHYTGDPNKSHRKKLAERTIERLLSAGFYRAQTAYQGVVALK